MNQHNVYLRNAGKFSVQFSQIGVSTSRVPDHLDILGVHNYSSKCGSVRRLSMHRSVRNLLGHGLRCSGRSETEWRLEKMSEKKSGWLFAKVRMFWMSGFVALAVMGVLTVPVFARSAQSGEGVESTLVVWDLHNPVNRTESRSYFAALWAAEDAGVSPEAFDFTNAVPGVMNAMLLPELEVLSEVYAHRLDEHSDCGGAQTIFDLIDSDSEIRAEFRRFVLTGKLSPRIETDAAAFLTHYAMALDGITVQAQCTVECVVVSDALLVSEGMRLVNRGPINLQTSPSGPICDPRLQCALTYLAEASRLKCMKTGGLYQSLSGAPDFDCDDFADAMLQYLLRMLPGWTGHYGILYWECPTGALGHAVTVLRDSFGLYYWVDAYSGIVYGPFGSEDDLRRSVESVWVPPGCVAKPKLWRVIPATGGGVPAHIPAEQPPWYTDLTQVRRFCERLAACCTQIVTPVPACDPGPYLQLPFVVSECNIRHYVSPAEWNLIPEPCQHAARP